MPEAASAPSISQEGLSEEEAARRLGDSGPNVLPHPKRPTLVRRVAGQLVHFFALMLWVAAALALVGGLPELGVAIVVVILLNAGFSATQEHRADRASERLRSLMPASVTVRRGGRTVRIEAAEVVEGDVVVLVAGDRIPADADLLEARGLSVDTSSFTGESEPTRVGDGRVLAGTFVVDGEAEALVVATGSATRLAGLARLTTDRPRGRSPLTQELVRVVRTVAVVAVGLGGAFFVLALLLGHAAGDGFVFAIGVTVALVPEALLPTVTLSLAYGAEQMARRQVLVRSLDAVETLGSTTFICTDKTGTLTLNQMTVVEVWTPEATATVSVPGYRPDAPVEVAPREGRDDVEALALAAARCSDGEVRSVEGRWVAHGDPMEAALDAFARRLGVDPDGDCRRRPVLGRFPFDPRRRRMSVVVGDQVLVKGAPDAVVSRCVDVDEEAAAALARLTGRGLRVLAVASRACGTAIPAGAEEAESSLTLLGLVAMEDPPRRGVREAIDACRRARIGVAMITGDHPATASAIADQVGLRRETDPVLVGRDLPEDEDVLAATLDHDGLVVARVAPEEKLRIAAALRRRGHVVAMTGDGVNDAPALSEADIGIAMGESGTDVAREAADLVLLDDHFATIVAGVEQGRATFVNIRRFLTYHLTDNVAELAPFVVWALSGGRIPLALGVLQILALDIGTDTLSAVALGAEPPAPGVLDRPPVSGRLLDVTVARRAFGVLGLTVTAASMTAFLVVCAAAGWSPGEAFPTGNALAAASGATFMAVVTAQSANAFACRSSTRRPGALGWGSNRLLPPAVALGVAVSLAMLMVPPIADRLGQRPPPAAGWVVVAVAPLLLLGVDAADKWWRGARRGTD